MVEGVVPLARCVYQPTDAFFYLKGVRSSGRQTYGSTWHRYGASFEGHARPRTIRFVSQPQCRENENGLRMALLSSPRFSSYTNTTYKISRQILSVFFFFSFFLPLNYESIYRVSDHRANENLVLLMGCYNDDDDDDDDG